MAKKTLKDFFEWWLEEATSENPCHGVTICGLCANLTDWCADNDLSPSQFEEQLDALLLEEAENNDCDNGYPFGYFEYQQRQSEETLHLDEKRLAFVRRMIEEL